MTQSKYHPTGLPIILITALSTVFYFTLLLQTPYKNIKIYILTFKYTVTYYSWLLYNIYNFILYREEIKKFKFFRHSTNADRWRIHFFLFIRRKQEKNVTYFLYNIHFVMKIILEKKMNIVYKNTLSIYI